ncbi:MAG: DUF4430 domain-containing protein [Clostridiales bacterium]|nr:DUF4430 domain-containing protein [Clostridiales bacterium]
MNNKIIIAIVSSLIVVCLAVGIGMNHKSGNSKDETNLISDIETVSAVDESSLLIETSETNSSEKSKETETSAKNKSTSNDLSTTKKNGAKAESSTKSFVKKETTSSAKTTVKKADKPTEKKEIIVTFSVNSEKAANYPQYIINPSKLTVENGTTVFDLLNAECRKNSIPLDHQNKSYVKAIDGLSEKDCGNGSGWTYLVNGVKPMMSASKYVLKDGDVVEWYYVTSPTD